MIGASPAGPAMLGSTTCSVNAVATAASKAFPPFSRIAMPAAVPNQCVAATMPKVPQSSGRVVKGGWPGSFWLGGVPLPRNKCSISCAFIAITPPVGFRAKR